MYASHSESFPWVVESMELQLFAFNTTLHFFTFLVNFFVNFSFASFGLPSRWLPSLGLGLALIGLGQGQVAILGHFRFFNSLPPSLP